jgi:hypothetical protein
MDVIARREATLRERLAIRVPGRGLRAGVEVLRAVRDAIESEDARRAMEAVAKRH